MKTKEFADACGVDKRTLFYYDEIGVLRPARILENGYREYDEMQLPRMGMIRMMQATGLTLREIGSILGTGDSPVGTKDPSIVKKALDESCERAEKLILEMKTGLAYIRKKYLMLEDYNRHHGESILGSFPHCGKSCAGCHDETHSQATVNIFTKELPALHIQTRLSDYFENMSVNYLTSGLFLGVAEDLTTLKPAYFFKITEPELADATVPAGRYACGFYEREVGSSFVLPLLVSDFENRLKAEKYAYEKTLYAHDLPGWFVGKPNQIIYCFTVLLRD